MGIIKMQRTTVIHHKISVVIPVKNGEKSIGKCLEAVFSQKYLPHEVIVIDGHSSDKTVEIASKFPVRTVYEDFGTVGGARQIGIENSSCELIAFTDADCIPEKNWLENLVKEMKENISGVGGCIKNVGRDTWGKPIALTSDTFLGSGNSVQGRIFKEKRYVKSISGCNSLYRKEDLITVGGFDTTLHINEDTDLSLRLSKIGKLLYTPDAAVLHDQSRELKAFAKRMYQFGYGRGKLRLWCLQCIVPLSIPVLFLSALFSPWILVGALFFYFFILIASGFKFALREKSSRYLWSIPTVYAIEHSAYSIGFLRGLFQI